MSQSTFESMAPEPTLFALDESRWYYKKFYIRFAGLVTRYHRTQTLGWPPPTGPCIYVTRHGHGYLSFDILIACYMLGWHAWHVHGKARHNTVRTTIADAKIDKFLPGIAHVKNHVGGVPPTEAACLAVLKAGEQLILTPGGRREAQPGGDPYALRWDKRYGSARLAIKSGAPVVPLAVVGGAEAFPGFRLGKLSFWSPLPLPVPFTVALGTPIAPDVPPSAVDDPQAVANLHETVWRATQKLYQQVLTDRQTVAS